MSENEEETKPTTTKSNDTILELQLGDVINITDPLNEILNDMRSCATHRTHKEIENYAHQLATILENNPTFNALELTGAFIQNEAALTIVKALEYNKTVTSLNLSNNYINANGIIAINTFGELTRAPPPVRQTKETWSNSKNSPLLSAICLMSTLRR